MTNSEYHAHPAISKSVLFKIRESPEKFRYYMDNPQPKTPMLVFGSAFHKWALEPEGFFSEFAVSPEINRRTKAGREEWEAFAADNSGKDIISTEDFETIRLMTETVRANKYARTLLDGSAHEQSFFWTDDLTGEECKCRPDILLDKPSVHIIADLKSCESADTDSFMRDAIKYGYHLQAFMYTDGVRRSTGNSYQFVFIAVEKKPPYAVNIMQADDLFIKYGEDTFRELIGIYHECKQTGNWWGYNGFSGIINNLGIPAYIRREYES